MMYSFKEKTILLRRLQQPDKAACDLRFLSARVPLHPELARFGRNPQRYASDILYALLDVATEEQILENRGQEARGHENGQIGNLAPSHPRTPAPPNNTPAESKKKPRRKRSTR